MADKKKVYSIVINGLKESVDLTKSLNEQMAQLESSLKKIKSTKIKIDSLLKSEQQDRHRQHLPMNTRKHCLKPSSSRMRQSKSNRK